MGGVRVVESAEQGVQEPGAGPGGEAADIGVADTETADTEAAGPRDEAEAPLEGPYEEFLVWGFGPRDPWVGAEQAVRLGQVLRRAVIARTPDPVPAEASGHGAEGRPHVAYLALPDVDRPHAVGRVRGVALAVPRGLPADGWRRLTRGVFAPPLTRLTVGKDWPVLQLTPETGAFRELQASRWTAAPHGARRWVTATPMLADGRLRRGRSAEDVVLRSFQQAGFPEPANVTCSEAPMLEGAPWRAAAGTIPERCQGMPRLHVRVEFQRPLVGPLLVGAMRYFGLGLFVPEAGQDGR